MRGYVIKVAAAAAVALSAGAASALPSATLNVQSFGSLENGPVNIAGALAARDAFHTGSIWHVTEDFEDFTLVDSGNGLPPSFTAPTIETAVGDFTAGGNGAPGTSVLDPTDQLHVRHDGDSGRYDTSDADDTGAEQYLDSNDVDGITWEVPGSATFPGDGKFDRLSFMLTDVDDVNAVNFTLKFDGLAQTFKIANFFGATKRPNGELLLFTVAFSKLIDGNTFEFAIDAGDGFAFDAAKISATPLPAAAWMLIAGVGALFGMRRFQKTAA